MRCVAADAVVVAVAVVVVVAVVVLFCFALAVVFGGVFVRATPSLPFENHVVSRCSAASCGGRNVDCTAATQGAVCCETARKQCADVPQKRCLM